MLPNYFWHQRKIHWHKNHFQVVGLPCFCSYFCLFWQNWAWVAAPGKNSLASFPSGWTGLSTLSVWTGSFFFVFIFSYILFFLLNREVPDKITSKTKVGFYKCFWKVSHTVVETLSFSNKRQVITMWCDMCVQCDTKVIPMCPTSLGRNGEAEEWGRWLSSRFIHSPTDTWWPFDALSCSRSPWSCSTSPLDTQVWHRLHTCEIQNQRWGIRCKHQHSA